MTNIIKHFINRVESQPNAIAIRCENEAISYSQLYAEIQKQAYQLKERGIKPGNRVLIMVPMSIELYEILLAIFYMGAVAVIIDNWKDKQFARECLKAAECDAVIYTRKTVIVSLFHKGLRQIKISHIFSIRPVNKAFDFVCLEPNSPALITFTTGSTGKPKATLRSHQFLEQQYKVLLDIIKPASNEIDFVSLPIVLLLNLGAGACSLITRKAIDKLQVKDLSNILNSLHLNEASRITASPYLVNQLAKLAISLKIKLPELKKVFTGGGPVFPKDAARIKEAFLSSSFTIIYGSTEAEPISIINDMELSESSISKGLSVGKIHSEIDLKIIRIQKEPIDSFVEVPVGDIGEIIVSGSHVLNTYYNSPDAFSANKINQDNVLWHRTGDAGYIDDHGRLYLCGRAERMINANNKILSPFLIEYQLSEIKGVEKGTIVRGENNKLILVVEPGRGANKKNIEANVSDLGFLIDSIHFIKKMPMDARHRTKIDYRQLLNKY